MYSTDRRRFLASAAAAAVALPLSAGAQPSFPNRPVRVIIGFPPGSALDPDARLITREMERRLGQPVVIEHKPGARGTIGAKLVASSPPDGHTLYYGNAISIHPIFNRNNAVDAAKDFSPVSASTRVPYYVIVRSTLPVRTLQELVEYGKAHPDELKHGAPSQTFDLIMSMLSQRTGVATRSIPYRASPDMIVALLAGDLDVSAGPVQTYVTHLRSGRLRALFVADSKRSALLPEVPTAAEFGLPGLEMGATNGFWAAAGTPRPVLLKLSEVVAAAVAMPEIAEQIRTGSGDDPVGSTPEGQLQAYQRDVRFWSDAAQHAKFTPS